MDRVIVSEKSFDFSTNAFLYYHIFSNLLYYTCLSPYKTTLLPVDEDGDGGQLTLHLKRHKVQSLLCAFLHLWVGVLSFFGFLATLFGRKDRLVENPTEIFGIAQALSFCSGIMILVYLIRSKRGLPCLFESCFQMTHGKLRMKTQCKKVNILMSLLALLMITLTLGCVLLGIDVGVEVGLLQLIELGKRGFGVKHLADSDWRWNILLSTGIVLLFTIRNIIVNIFGVLLPVTTSLYLLHLSSDFKRMLKDNPGMTFSQVLDVFDKAKKNVNTLNDILHVQTFVVLISGVSIFCSSLFKIFDHESRSVRVILMLYALSFTTWISISAKAAVKFQQFSKYLTRNIENPSFKREGVKVMIAIQHCSTRPLALRAAGFPITYSLLFSVLGSVLTYSAILLQFNTSTKMGN